MSWGGIYSKSQNEAIFRPFTRASGIPINSKVYAGNLDEIRAQAARGDVLWDVVDLDPADVEAGCNEGLLETLSFVLPAAPDGTAAVDDFLPGTLHRCGVGSVAWSMLIAHGLGSESDRSGDAQPSTLRDFFNLAAFPGGRGLRRTPMANLEWALLADGVAPSDVYGLLRTEAGVERAFAKLDSIRESIVWWQDAGEPAQLLTTGQVVMTSTFNAPIFNDIAVRQRAFELIWDGQVWDIDLWAIPANAKHREAAQRFLRFATSTQPLARQTRWIPYGPVRRSSAPLVDGFILADVEVAPFLPTTPDNLQTALRNDAQFWREEGPALVERFNTWLAR
ncbi:MAG: extracellular solute-binding protein [Kiloniellaceae bacterium]